METTYAGFKYSKRTKIIYNESICLTPVPFYRSEYHQDFCVYSFWNNPYLNAHPFIIFHSVGPCYTNDSSLLTSIIWLGEPSISAHTNLAHSF